MRAYLLLIIAGCSVGEPTPCEPAVGVDFFSDAILAIVDRSARHVVGVPVTCSSLAGVYVQASILDPQNRLVPVAVQVEFDDTLRAALTFRPSVPGLHHVAVRFEPNLGFIQDDVMVAATHQIDDDAGLRLAAELEACGRIDVTPGGLAVCLGSPTTIYAGPVRLQELTLGPLVAMADGALWTGSGERWVEGTQIDGGPGFRREPEQGLSFSSTAAITGPTVSDVVLIDEARTLRRIKCIDGGLAETVLSVAPPRYFDNAAVWWRDGNVIMGNDFFWRAGELIIGNNVQSCRLLDGGTQICDAPAYASAVDPNGIWVMFAGAPFRSFLRLARPAQILELPLPIGMEPRSSRQEWNVAPVFSYESAPWAGTYVASYRNGLVLDRYDGEVHSANHEWVFLRNPLRAFPRR